MARSLREIGILAGRALRRTGRNPAVVVSYLFQPLVYLLIFTKLFGAVGDVPGFQSLGYESYLSFFLPGLLVFAVLVPALTSGLATILDVHTGALDGFLRSPVRRSSILAGKLAADAARMMAQTLLLVLVAIAMGARLAGPLQALAGIALAVGLGMALAGVSNLLALRTRSIDATSALGNLLILPLLFLSTAYMPRDLLPRWLQLTAAANPLTYVIEAARSLFTSAASSVDHALAVAAVMVVVLGTATLGAAASAFRKVAQ